ncbi:hypothetical protein QOT17_005445 [Balamuthia mandrillaris]
MGKNASKLMFKAMDGELELNDKVLKKLWDRYDKNKDDQLDKEETQMFWKELKGAAEEWDGKYKYKVTLIENKAKVQSLNEKVSDAGVMFDTIDTNKDGIIDYSEFCAFLLSRQKEHLETGFKLEKNGPIKRFEDYLEEDYLAD